MKKMSSKKKPNSAMRPDLPGSAAQHEQPKPKSSQANAMVNAAKNGCAQS